MPGDQPLVRNAALNVFGEAAWGFGYAVIAPATVLMSLLHQHGAGERAAGVIGAIEGGAMMLQVAGPYIFPSRRRRKQHILAWHFATMLPFLYIMGLIAAFCGGSGGGSGGGLSDRAFVMAMLATFACFHASMGMVVAVWMDWFAHLFDASVRGTVSGVVWGTMAVAEIAGVALAGRLLASLPPDHVYGTLFAICGVSCTMSIALFWFIVDPAADQEEAPPPRGRALVERFALSLRDRNVRAVIVARILGNAGLCALPFVVLVYASVSGGALGAATLVVCAIGVPAGRAVAVLVFGRVADRHGNRLAAAWGAGLQVAALGVALAWPGVAGCAVTYALLGLATGCANVGFYLVHETCPHDSRLAHLVVSNLAIGVFALVVPMCGGFIAERLGVGAMLAIGLAASLASLAWTLLAVREPREIAHQTSSRLGEHGHVPPSVG